MNKKQYGIYGVLTASLLASGVCLAGAPDLYNIASQCNQVVRQLDELAGRNQRAPCVESIELSSMYLGAAGNSLRSQRAPQASMYLNLALKEMSDLSFTPKCSYFVSRVTPYIVTVSQLKNEVEQFDPYLKANKQ